jgi:hypothetical protein
MLFANEEAKYAESFIPGKPFLHDLILVGRQEPTLVGHLKDKMIIVRIN